MTEVAEHPDVLRRAGFAVVALGASELLGKVATFLTLLLLARLLGVAEFGVFSFGLSLGLLLAVLSSLDLDERVVQIGSARPELLDRCYGALIAIRAVLSVVVMAATTVVVFEMMNLDDASAVFYLVAACLLDTFSDAARAACGARQRQELSAVVLVVQRFSALGLSVGALVVSRDGELAALGYLVATAVGVAAMQVAARRAGARPRIRGSMPEIRMVVRAAPVTALDSIASMGVFRLDAALIGVLIGTNAVGVYGASYRIFESVLFVSWTLSRAYVPVVASRPDDPEHMRAWAQRSLVVVCAAYLPYGVVLALRGEDLVSLLFGQAYVDRGLLLGLAAAPLFFGIAHLSASMLLALRPDPVVGLASVAALVLNVGLNLWLIPVWGLTAAAVATTLAFLLRALIVTTALTRITGTIVAVRPLAVVVVAAAVTGVVVEAVPSVALALPAAAAVFLVLWVLGSRWIDPAGFAELVAKVRGRRVPAGPAR
ncbi:oligosaccharide flippase family protein [Nocardioides sp. MH1]|uniref:oligosaccharide flippase family protein n=1 Tax=Nocardioides sp. MH1 TaxID=3242490 RepID=UPI0035205C27